jgi:ankyrin repeat protein
MWGCVVSRATLAAAALALATAALAQELPKPSPLTQKELDAKQISYNDWLFFHGIRSGNLDWVNAAFKAGADLNKSRNPIGELPPLMVAVSTPAARREIVELLIKRGADVNQRWTPKSGGQGGGFFPLYQAARNSNSEIVELLIQRGADVKARTANGNTALHNTFDADIGRVLLRHGAEVNARNKIGQSPLGVAKRAISMLDREPNPELRPKVVAYQAFLRSQGAVE